MRLDQINRSRFGCCQCSAIAFPGNNAVLCDEPVAPFCRCLINFVVKGLALSDGSLQVTAGSWANFADLLRAIIEHTQRDHPLNGLISRGPGSAELFTVDVISDGETGGFGRLEGFFKS
jgi:hypothetical protein